MTISQLLRNSLINSYTWKKLIFIKKSGKRANRQGCALRAAQQSPPEVLFGRKTNQIAENFITLPRRSEICGDDRISTQGFDAMRRIGAVFRNANAFFPLRLSVLFYERHIRTVFSCTEKHSVVFYCCPTWVPPPGTVHRRV